MSKAPKTEVKDEMPEVTARRLKKRELDRKAQRMARERTKSRIAHLEELVGHLSHNDTNAEVSQLMDRLLHTTQERDKLVGVLTSLGTTIKHHTEALTTQQAGSSSSSVVSTMRALTDQEHSVGMKSLQQAHNHGPLTISHGRRDHYHASTHNIPPPPNGYGWGFDAHEMHQGGGNSAAMPPYLRDAVLELDEIPPNPAMFPRSDSEFSSETSSSRDGYIIPPPPQPCDCDTVIERGSHSTADHNTWREANHALGRSVKLSQLAMEAEDRASQDTPVRAIVEGWDSVERAGLMTDSWRKLRMLDEICFSRCGLVERLATLKMMHILISYHGDPTPERLAALPRWFRTRPSQSAIPHSYAIDFFVWPGVRERFVFSQHRYCTNTFWELFRSNLTILWQYDFNDCFMQNAATGRFQLAPLFEERIRDIKSWTMNVDFLNRFPELCDDIPMYGGIPPKPNMSKSTTASAHARWSSNTTPRLQTREIKRDEDAVDVTPQPQQQTQLSDDIAKSSSIVIPGGTPAFAGTEYMSQPSGPHIPISQAPGFAYEPAANMVPTTLAPADLTPAGQHVYSGGTWFYSYCQQNYT